MGAPKRIEKASVVHRPTSSETPQLEIKCGGSKLVGLARVVHDPRQVGGFFERGELVLVVHLETNSFNPREVAEVLRKFGETRPSSAARGYVGGVGDTFNHALRKHLARWLTGKEMRTPMLDQVAVKGALLGKIAVDARYKKFWGKPVKRSVFRF